MHNSERESITETYFHNGFTLVNDFYSQKQLAELTKALQIAGVFNYMFRDNDSHNLLKSLEAVNSFANDEKLLAIAKNIIGNNAVPFYAIILDKTRNSNWGLDWHQDLKVAVKERVDITGYNNWSLESGIWHVVPPVGILEQLLAIRIHLDDCNETNGAVWAIPGSHGLGIIPQAGIRDTVEQTQIHICNIQAGGIMFMSPLLLHKSPYSVSDKSRRVLQIEYRAAELNNGLEWFN